MNRIIKEVRGLNPTFDIRGKLIDVFGSSSLILHLHVSHADLGLYMGFRIRVRRCKSPMKSLHKYLVPLTTYVKQTAHYGHRPS